MSTSTRENASIVRIDHLPFRTSSVGNDILGFDAAGNVVNESDSHGGIQDWTLICQKAAKVKQQTIT